MFVIQTDLEQPHILAMLQYHLVHILVNGM